MKEPLAVSRLLIVMIDPLTPIIRKGEIVERYHNPGNLFDEVHFLLLNDDRPDPAQLQPLVGRARVFVHNAPMPRQMVVRTLGWRPWLVRPYVKALVDRIKAIAPDVTRALNPWVDGFVCAETKRLHGIPYIISLHANPDLDYRGQKKPEGGIRGFVNYQTMPALERLVISGADTVVCVYKYILPYARRMGARASILSYNVVATSKIVTKTDYALGTPPRLLMLGRQLPQKDPSPVIRAVSRIPGLHAGIFGNGPIHESLEALATEVGAGDRIEFHTSVLNSEICARMREYDIMVSVNDYGGVSKVELESATAGLPIVTNLHPLEDEPEVLGQACIGVSGTEQSYVDALQKLLGDEALRRRLGEGVRRNVAELDGPRMESQLRDVYLKALGERAPT
jgi:glycosyltransferase involved in cell wall biosynthesis